MKKLNKILPIMLLVFIPFTLISCGSESASDVVKTYLEEVKKGENGEVDKLFADMVEETEEASNDTADAEESQAVNDAMSNVMKKLDYKINSESVEGDIAKVNVTITGANLSQALVSYMQEAMGKMLELAFSGTEISDEESNKIVEEVLVEKLNTAEVQERTNDITLNKVDGNWVIQGDDSLTTLLLGTAE